MFWLLIAWYQQNNIRFRNLAQYTRETYTIRLGVWLTGLVLGRSPARFVQKCANSFSDLKAMCCAVVKSHLISSLARTLSCRINIFRTLLCPQCTVCGYWILTVPHGKDFFFHLIGYLVVLSVKKEIFIIVLQRVR